jgi:hypothetical protein
MFVFCDKGEGVSAFSALISHQFGVLAQTGKAAHLMHCGGAHFAAARFDPNRMTRALGEIWCTWLCARLHHFVCPDGCPRRNYATVYSEQDEQKSLHKQPRCPEQQYFGNSEVGILE